MNSLWTVMYHYVRPIKNSRYPNIKGLELDLFKEQLNFFKEHFQVVTMEAVMEAVEKGTELPENAMLLTFDDGYRDHYQYVFPLLREFGMQGSFFVPSAIIREQKVLDVNKIHFILACSEIRELMVRIEELLEEYRRMGHDIEPTAEIFEKLAVANRWDPKEVIYVKRLLQNYLPEELRHIIVDRLFVEIVGCSEEEFSKELYVDMDMIREMKKAGMHFGLHGDAHYWLNKLTREELEKDLRKSLSFFEDVMEPEKLTINYPYGGYNDDVIACAKAMGCKLGFTVEARKAVLCEEDALTLPRFDTNDFPPKSDHWRKLEKPCRK